MVFGFLFSSLSTNYTTFFFLTNPKSLNLNLCRWDEKVRRIRGVSLSPLFVAFLTYHQARRQLNSYYIIRKEDESATERLGTRHKNEHNKWWASPLPTRFMRVSKGCQVSMGQIRTDPSPGSAEWFQSLKLKLSLSWTKALSPASKGLNMYIYLHMQGSGGNCTGKETQLTHVKWWQLIHGRVDRGLGLIKNKAKAESPQNDDYHH